MFDVLENWYEMGLESNDSLKNWVIGEVITADQYQQITGTLYSF